MIKSNLLLVILALITLVKAAPVPPVGFEHHMAVVADTYDLYWQVKEEEIHFEVQVKTLGYVGFGISRTGGMMGADIVTGWVKDDVAYFQDRHSTENAEPVIDEEQNWSLLEANETDGYTILRFKRPLETCDKNDVAITRETMRVIYAYHPDDPEEGNSTEISYHGNHRRGTKSVTLLLYDAQKTTKEIPAHTGYVEFRNPNITVPAKSTTYWCHGFKMPKQLKKHHVVRLEAVVAPGNEGIVHHITFYACHRGQFNETAHEGLRGDCDEDPMGALANCSSIIYAWAVGGEPVNMPDHVGYPIGGDGFTMLKMETHFDNPSSKSGMIDQSGIRMYYTDKLREFDTGILGLAYTADHNLAIPPKYEKFVTQAHCNLECFNAVIPKGEDLKIIGVMLHAHLLGRRVAVRHFRKGKELAPIANDRYYDFNFQDFRMLPKEIVVKRGDSLMVECEYKSTGRTNVTFGGISTTDEMCIAYLLYYPKKAFSLCSNAPVPRYLVQFINPQIETIRDDYWFHETYHFIITSPKEFATTSSKDYSDIFYKIDWSDPKWRKKYQDHILKQDVQFLQYCNDGYDKPILWRTLFKTPKIKQTYKAPPGKCSAHGIHENPLVLIICFIGLAFLN